MNNNTLEYDYILIMKLDKLVIAEIIIKIFAKILHSIIFCLIFALAKRNNRFVKVQNYCGNSSVGRAQPCPKRIIYSNLGNGRA